MILSWLDRKHDPAAVNSAKTAQEALLKIARHRALFISRGDDSGTHKKQLALWIATGQATENAWYREAGQSMGKVLQMADELQAYTLTDRGTWLAYKHAQQSRLALKIVFSGDPALYNPYGVIALNPERYPELNHQGVKAFISWLISPEGRQLPGKQHPAVYAIGPHP